MIDNTQRTSDAFIDDQLIFQLLADGKSKASDASLVKQIIEKARTKHGLTSAEVAILLQVENQELIKKMFSTAAEIKEAIYGKRIVLFAPLYISSYCVNNCVYCGYCASNEKQLRRRLSMEDVAQEVKILEALGHKRLAVEALSLIHI